MMNSSFGFILIIASLAMVSAQYQGCSNPPYYCYQGAITLSWDDIKAAASKAGVKHGVEQWFRSPGVDGGYAAFNSWLSQQLGEGVDAIQFTSDADVYTYDNYNHKSSGKANGKGLVIDFVTTPVGDVTSFKNAVSTVRGYNATTPNSPVSVAGFNFYSQSLTVSQLRTRDEMFYLPNVYFSLTPHNQASAALVGTAFTGLLFIVLAFKFSLGDAVKKAQPVPVDAPTA